MTTIPDNAVQTLHFTDPHTGANNTCTDPCPLLTDPNVPYQDFLFDGPLDITGFQLSLSQWTGAAPGLHLLQLLSSGSFASSIGSDNGVSCFAPAPSNTSRTGTWNAKQANTNIPGTLQTVLISDIKVGTPSAQASTFTWMPYVSASGIYDVTIRVPGCTNLQDCAMRTTVTVTVFPGQGLPPTIQEVDQRNTDDALIPLYSGPVVPSSPDFTTTVTMTLSDNPQGTGQNGQYEIVADRIQLVLKSPTTSGNETGSITGNQTSTQSTFGFLEWPLSSTSAANTTGLISNSSVTSLDTAGFDLFNALGGNSNGSLGSSSISSVVQHPSGEIFVGGSFKLSSGTASSASNIVSFNNGALAGLAQAGLNGAVTSVVLDGNTLFVGGSFTDTPSGSTHGSLRGIAKYDIQGNEWSPLEGGVDGTVSSLSLADDQLLVAGNFTTLLSSSGTNVGRTASGFAVWNVTSGQWANGGGIIVGNITFVSNTSATSDTNSQVVAGHISASYEFGASGFIMLQNGGSDGVPKVTALTLPINSASANSTSSSSAVRRSHSRRSASSIIPRLGQLFRRQTASASSLAPLPTPPPVTAPSVLAGAFWNNGSSHNEVVILGGNFSFNTASGAVAQNLVLYNPTDSSIKALQGNAVNGTVSSLLVQDDRLYVGGNFTVQGTGLSGFAVYDLKAEGWDTTGVQSLQGNSGSAVVVRSVTTSPSQANTIIVAGSFAQAGSTPCRAICSFDTQSKQWSALGSGIQGDVASVDYAGVCVFSYGVLY